MTDRSHCPRYRGRVAADGTVMKPAPAAEFEPVEPEPVAVEPVEPVTVAPEPPAAPAPDPFEAMRRALRHGVQVVAAPQLFPTPPAIAAQMVVAADIPKGARVLEPSAGTGRLLDAIRADTPAVFLHAVELNHNLAGRLRVNYPGVTVEAADFLAVDPPAVRFDRVVMNPPFVQGADIRHIEHAARFLAPGGRLVALCADGPRQRERLRPLATDWRELPADSFADEGTGVRVAMLIIDA